MCVAPCMYTSFGFTYIPFTWQHSYNARVHRLISSISNILQLHIAQQFSMHSWNHVCSMHIFILQLRVAQPHNRNHAFFRACSDGSSSTQPIWQHLQRTVTSSHTWHRLLAVLLGTMLLWSRRNQLVQPRHCLWRLWGWLTWALCRLAVCTDGTDMLLSVATYCRLQNHCDWSNRFQQILVIENRSKPLRESQLFCDQQ